MSVITDKRLAEVLVEAAGTFVREFDVIEFLQTLTVRATELSGAQATGLLLAGPGKRLHFMAASDERVHLLELFQIQADEGPCRDCYREGVRVPVSNLLQVEERWPVFVPAAIEAGFAAVHAFPLRMHQQVIGSLGLFNAQPFTMTEQDAQAVQALADLAAIAVLKDRTVREKVLLDKLRAVLVGRIAIEQAKGVIARSYHVSIDSAYAMLRGYCQAHHLHLSDVAQDIVADPAGMPDLKSE